MVKINGRLFPWTEILAARGDAEEVWVAPKRPDVGPQRDWFPVREGQTWPGAGWVKNHWGKWIRRPPKVLKKPGNKKGYKPSKETVAKWVAMMKLKPRTPEHNLKISQSMKKHFEKKRMEQSDPTGDYQLQSVSTG